ncbi:hypothetical protein TWF788_007421 [Orbilia oligospora]|uniref:Uncharacterized protein n=1 Tax=Orbilia oligospora TaxID=2813651 RepID=A0A7C8PT84_ORBOL|nr:hypothetical protein TWF788_007421 [Orbilia oligospora]
MPQDNTEVKQNQAVVFEVPLTYNDTLRWIIKSSEQPFSEQMNPQTGTKDPIFDFDRKELYNANVSVEPFGIQPTYGNSQGTFETLIYDDISQREKSNCVSTNITSGGAPFLIRHPICLLTHQFYEDTLDGRLSISPQPATHVFQNWDLALHSKGDNSERKWLPAGFEPESKYWSDYWIFATYLTTERTKKPVLQFNVNENTGDTSKYTGHLTWFDSSTDGFFYATNWNIAARKIKISWRDFSKEYFLTHSDLLKSPPTSKKVIKDRDSLLELNTTYPDPGAVLDSGTLWTRLHPWVVDRVYNRIPGVVRFNTTYYLPCDIPSYTIPKISFEIAQTRGAKGGRSTRYPVKKEGFIIKSYKHPESGSHVHTREASVDKTGLLSIPIYLDGKSGWYGKFRVGKIPARRKDELEEWMLEIATAESATGVSTFISGILMAHINLSRRLMGSRPLASQEDWSCLTWKGSNIKLEAKDSSGNRRVFWGNSQRYQETDNNNTLPWYDTERGSLSNITANNIQFVDNIAFSFLSFQNGRDELDGTIVLAVPGKPLSGVLTFGTSFVSKTSVVLQFGVDPDHGDTSQYDSRSDFNGFEPNFGGSSYNCILVDSRGFVYSHWLVRINTTPELANNEEIPFTFPAIWKRGLFLATRRFVGKAMALWP